MKTEEDCLEGRRRGKPPHARFLHSNELKQVKEENQS